MRFVKTAENLFGLPQGFTRVEYLQSTGTQYIDTGVVPTTTTEIRMGIEVPTIPSGTRIWGGTNIANDGNATYAILRKESNNSNFNFRVSYDDIIYCSLDTNKKYDIIMNEYGSRKLIVSGNDIGTFTGTVSTNIPMYIFARNTSGTAETQYSFNTKLYYFSIKDSNGILVRDYIPALDPLGVPCMYDLVGKKPYYNQGTGTFTVGRQIIPVEYLEGTGTQYIDTGLDYFADFEIGIQLRNNVSNKALGNGGYYCMQRQNSATPTWQFTSGSGNFYNSTTSITEHHVMKWKDNKVYSDDTFLTNFTKDSNIPHRMYLYTTGTNNKYPNVIYFCKLWNPADGTLVRDYIPAIDENGVGFMFDEVSSTVFLNSGTGSFSVGENKYKTKLRLIREVGSIPAGCKEVEYLESTGTQIINTGIPFVAQDDYIIKTRSVNFDTSKRAIIISNYIAYNQYSALSLEWWAGSSSYNGKARAYCVTKTGTSGTSTSSDTALSINVPHDLELNYSRTNNTITLNWDGNIKSDTLQQATLPDSSGSFCLFSDERPSLPDTLKNPTRIYYLQIYHNGTLVRDFIPVLDNSNRPAMYDQVSGQLFYNQGSGDDFSYGRQIHNVDYLETTGTQYIDCGLRGNQDTSTSITFRNTQMGRQGIVIGSRSSATSNNISTISPAASGGSNYNVVNDFGNYNTTRQIVALQAMTDKVTAYNSKSLRTVYNHETGVTNTVTTTYTGTFTTPTNLYIAYKSAGYASSQYNFVGEIYDCKIWDGDTLVRDFIPAIDENGVGFMFDRVSHTCYLNKGTGSFISGRPVCKVRFIKDVVPREYAAVNYIESTGTQYIDTGFTPNQNTKSELDYKIITDLSSGFPLFGSRTSASSKGYSYQRYGSGVMGGQYGSHIAYSNVSPDLNRHIVIRDKNKIYLDGTEIASNNTSTFTCPANLYLNAMNNNGTAAVQNAGVAYYGMKIYDNNTIVRNFVPVVRRIDKVAGMWDTVTKQFYGNSGTGNFNYG